MTGFVTFVSAGPGDPELLTVKAVKALAAADAVLFDDLSSGPILALANPKADMVGVGKRAGRASPKQDHVSRLLVDYAQTGARVVRLKSGDSGIFGRLEEELTAVRAAGIACEIIPGVTSASAAAAAAGIPLTRRQQAQRVQFITAADVTGSLPPGLLALDDELLEHGVPLGFVSSPLALSGDVLRRTFSSRLAAFNERAFAPSPPG